MEYNGWKNKETWLVNVWFGDYITEIVEEQGHPISAETYENIVEEALEEGLEQDIERKGFIGDLFNCAWYEIDWRELAKHTD